MYNSRQKIHILTGRFVTASIFSKAKFALFLSKFQVSRSFLADFEALIGAMLYYPLHFYEFHKLGLLLLSVFTNVMFIYLYTYNIRTTAMVLP